LIKILRKRATKKKKDDHSLKKSPCRKRRFFMSLGIWSLLTKNALAIPPAEEGVQGREPTQRGTIDMYTDNNPKLTPNQQQRYDAAVAVINNLDPSREASEASGPVYQSAVAVGLCGLVGLALGGSFLLIGFFAESAYFAAVGLIWGGTGFTGLVSSLVPYMNFQEEIISNLFHQKNQLLSHLEAHKNEIPDTPMD
jgi:hypothetical protein